LQEAPRDVSFGLKYVLDHAKSHELQNRCLRALTFKTELLWAQLDALHHAYVEPGLIPPGAFVPEDRKPTVYER
jgi:pyrroloquinoline-quinone synthase